MALTTTEHSIQDQMKWLVGPGRRYFIESQFKVIDKNGKLSPLKFWPLQEQYWNGRSLRDRYLKFRQGGISTIAHADVISECMLVPGLAALILVQKPEDKSIPVHRDRADLFIKSVSPEFTPKLKVNSLHHIQFEFNDGQTSSVYFGSSGSKGIGRGETLQRVIREELGEWEEDEERSTHRMMQGMPFNSRVIDIGTPNGMDTWFYQMWESAKKGDEAFTAHLFPWFLDAGYILLPDSFLVKGTELGGDLVYTDVEEGLVNQHGLSEDQIRWRRYRIRMAGSVENFWQEYLEDDVSCWLMSGTPVMDGAVLSRAAAHARPPISVKGNLKVWAHPEAGEGYVIMGDPAEGLTTGHRSAAIVRRVRGWEHVATLSGQIPPGEFGGEMVEVARRYNNALVGWERNNHGWGVRERVVNHLRYPNVYKYVGEFKEEGDDRFGFPTNRWTKPGLVSRMSEFMGTGWWDSPDVDLINEYRKLQDDGKGAYDTSVLDLAMADMLCLEARGQAERRTRPRPKTITTLPGFLQ